MKLINDILSQQDNTTFIEPLINKAKTNIITKSESNESDLVDNDFWD